MHNGYAFMIRQTTRPATGQCTLPMYMGFLISEPKHANCTRLAEVSNISHDSVNRFLLREKYEPHDLFVESSKTLNLTGGILSVDDTTLDKPYSHHMALVGYFWSGKHHKVVKGISLITMYYTDPDGVHLPVNYRIYDHSENKTKNEYFQAMLDELLLWGLKPAMITGDSWYSCVKNLKRIKNHSMGLMFGVESNRLVSLEKGTWQQVQSLTIPVNGMLVYLRNFGRVKVFKTQLKDQLRHYIVYLPETSPLDAYQGDDFKIAHDAHWHIEQYHRAIKQLCHIEHFQVRGKIPISNPIFSALCGYVHLQKVCATQLLSSLYQMQRALFKEVVAEFIESFVVGKNHLNPQFKRAVNA